MEQISIKQVNDIIANELLKYATLMLFHEKRTLLIQYTVTERSCSFLNKLFGRTDLDSYKSIPEIFSCMIKTHFCYRLNKNAEIRQLLSKLIQAFL